MHYKEADESMEQPLLDLSDEDRRENRIIVHPGPFDLLVFLKYVFSCWQRLLGNSFI